MGSLMRKTYLMLVVHRRSYTAVAAEGILQLQGSPGCSCCLQQLQQAGCMIHNSVDHNFAVRTEPTLAARQARATRNYLHL